MSVTLTYASTATVAEVLTTNTDSTTAANRTVTHTEFNESGTYTGATAVPVTTCAFFVKALAAGTATVDLTALTGTNGAAVDGSGLKLQYIRVKNLGANVLALKFGAANPYNLAGATWTITLSQNQIFEYWGNDATPDIAVGAKNIDMAGTLVQTSEWTIVMG